jgi:hypothetical protein
MIILLLYKKYNNASPKKLVLYAECYINLLFAIDKGFKILKKHSEYSHLFGF